MAKRDPGPENLEMEMQQRSAAREYTCPNCGAPFAVSEAKCPYCGYIYVPGAERKFMQGLEETRQQLDKVDDEARANYRAEWKKSSMSVTKIILIAVIVIAAIAAFFIISERMLFRDDKEDYAKEMVWQHEHFPELDELYEAGKFEEARELLYEYGEEDHDVWNWEHYDEVMDYDTEE